jgi:pSer/pThr/pTyr-binding forkhead associated (FHA) protein
MDYGSSAGVLLNGERIGKREELLYKGDTLQMGNSL